MRRVLHQLQALTARVGTTTRVASYQCTRQASVVTVPGQSGMSASSWRHPLRPERDDDERHGDVLRMNDVLARADRNEPEDVASAHDPGHRHRAVGNGEGEWHAIRAA